MPPIFLTPDIEFLVSDRYISDYFDSVMGFRVDPKIAFNLIKNEVMAYLKKDNKTMKDFTVDSLVFAELVILIMADKVNTRTKKIIFEDMVEKDMTPSEIIKERGLIILTNEEDIRKLVLDIIGKNEKSVEEFKAGKERAVKHLIGCVMKETNGLVHGEKLNAIMLEELQSIKI